MSDSRRAVIIGAGITGVLTALELLEHGWDVTVLEGAHIGAGSSSRTAAGIRQQFSTAATVLGMRYAVDYYKHFHERVGSEHCPIVQNGYLFLSDDPEAWEAAKKRVAYQHELGLQEVEALEGDALTERFPWIDGEVILGGTFCPTDGFLHPNLVYQDGADRVRALGGIIRQGAPVQGVELDGDRIVAVTTPKGRFEGDVFIDATNAWTNRLAKILGATELEVEPLKRYLWFIVRDGEMDADTMAAMPLVIAPNGVYVRPENRDTLQMGWKHEAKAENDFTYDDQDRIEAAYSHDSGLDALPFEAWMAVAECIPAIGEFAGINATTSGYYATTPDHNPFMGYDPARPNLIRLVGFSGHGAMFGPFTAAVARALAEAGEDVDTVELPLGEVALDEFKLGRAYTHAESLVI